MDKNSAYRGLSIAAVAMLGLTLMVGIFTAPTPTAAAPTYQSSSAVKVTTVPANGTTTLTARGFCLAFGKPFPTGATSVNGLAPDKVRNALNYSIDKGYTSNNAAQVQLAVWFLQDNTWHNQDNVTAQEIVTNSATSTIPTVNAVALTDAMAQKSVDVSATFVPQTADAFYGDGSVTITNTTSSDMNIYLPIGTLFTVPNGNGQFQDLAVFELVQAEGTPTVSAASTVTATAGVTETVVPIATDTAVATGAPATSVPIATATEPATVEVSTPTEVATVAVSTPTQVPTIAPARPTATSAPVALPQTGDPGSPNVALALLGVALLMAVVGLFVRFRKA
jgi:LPXTG-motif cell wall-anchored protein